MKRYKWYIYLCLILSLSIPIYCSIPVNSATSADGIPIVEVSGGINTSMVVDNKVLTIDAGWLHAIMAGNIPNHTYTHIRGHSHSVGVTDQELSALGTAGFGNWPSAAAGVVLVSTDVDDDGDPVDTGARTVIVRGLDANWALATATVTMNGTTPTAATAQTFIRINELEVVTAGTSLTNEGDITASISGTNIIRMYAEHSTSDSGRYTIPVGHTGHYENLEGSGIGNKEMTYHLFCRDTTISDSPFLLRASWHSKDGGFRPNGRIEPFTEKTDIILVAHSEIAGAKASASFEGWIEEN